MEEGSEEIVLCDYVKVLQRDPTHSLDWITWQNHLPITIESDFIMDESFF